MSCGRSDVLEELKAKAEKKKDEYLKNEAAKLKKEPVTFGF